MLARFTFSLLLMLVAVIRGYYLLRFAALPLAQRKPRAWYDWLAETGALSVAGIGSLYVVSGEQMPLRFADDDFARSAGLLLFAAGVGVFALSHHALARQWTWNIGLRDSHALVRRGVYRLVRHPMYTAIAAWLLATPLITQSWLGCFPLVALPGLYLRARAEETILSAAMGEAYTLYRARTGMFLPKVSL